MNFQIGDTVGGYEIVGVLGSGGMGEVYRVRNVISDRVDAMKVLLAGLQRDNDFAARFLREIKVQARLVHPNIAQLYTAFESQGNLMMILELVDGMSLLEILQRGRLPLASAVEYASQALTALNYAHGQGVIHRDIKPGNIMVTRTGVVKLMDFGIAKAATDRSLTTTGNLIGSLYYMSPEQVRAEAIDSRSDLYSVGVVLYQMATGRKPFEGDSEYSIMRAQVENKPPPPSSIDTSVPDELSSVILRALAKHPSERFQTGEEFREALEKVSVLLWEDEIGTTRMLGRTPRTGGAPQRRQPEAPTAPRQAAPRAAAETTAPAQAPAPAQPMAPLKQDAKGGAPLSAGVADEPLDEPQKQPSRSRTPLWIGVGIAAAVLVVAGTQVHDWMASEPTDRPVAGTQAAIESQSPAQISPEPQRPAPVSEPEPPAVQAPPTPANVPITPANVPRQTAAAPASGREAVSPPSRQQPPEAAPRNRAMETAAKSQTPSAAPPASPPPSNPVPPATKREVVPGEARSVPGQTSAAAARPPAEPVTQAAGGAPNAGTPNTSAPNTAPASAPAGSVTKQSDPPAEPEASARPTQPSASPAPATPPPAPDRVYDPDEVDSRPRLLRQVQPLYTEAAQKAGVQGRVRLSAEIWPDGLAHNIRVVESVGHPDLDRNAAVALSRWQFAPGRKDGAPVKVRAVIDQTFRLQGQRGAPALSKDQ